MLSFHLIRYGNDDFSTSWQIKCSWLIDKNMMSSWTLLRKYVTERWDVYAVVECIVSMMNAVKITEVLRLLVLLQLTSEYSVWFITIVSRAPVTLRSSRPHTTPAPLPPSSGVRTSQHSDPQKLGVLEIRWVLTSDTVAENCGRAPTNGGLQYCPAFATEMSGYVQYSEFMTSRPILYFPSRLTPCVVYNVYY